MSGAVWQWLACAAILLGALLLLAWSAGWLGRRPRAACTGCTKCPLAEETVRRMRDKEQG